jgi:hypothetical protein
MTKPSSNKLAPLFRGNDRVQHALGGMLFGETLAIPPHLLKARISL